MRTRNSRREFLKRAGLGAAAVALGGETRVLSADAEMDAEGERPNIVIIMADDMGWSDIGCYGGEIPTPNIDSLAKDGLRFSQFYNNSICGPTRASLLTGLYCQQTKHRGDYWNDPMDFSRCVTIAEVLKLSGYHTMMVGKWQGRDLPGQRGFDRFFGPQCKFAISYFNEVKENQFYLNDQKWTFPEKGFYLTDAFTEHAIQFLEEARSQEKPFLLYAAYIAPHWPLHASEDDIKPHRERYLRSGWDQWRDQRFKQQQRAGLFAPTAKLCPKPKDIPDWADNQHKQWQAERMAVYAAQVTNLDRGVGRILKSIEDAGKTDNTLVIFLSDNGASDQAGGVNPFSNRVVIPKGQWRLDGVAMRPGSGPDNMPGPADTFSGYGPAWANLSNTPFKGYKCQAYEGGIRTPLIVRWPKGIKDKGKVTNQVGHVIDLMATCVDLARTHYPETLGDRKPLPMEGKSLAAILDGKEQNGHDALYWSALGQAVRMGKWKLVNARKGTPWELYDMDMDPGETNNLAEAHPELVKDMSDKFKAWEKRVGLK